MQRAGDRRLRQELTDQVSCFRLRRDIDDGDIHACRGRHERGAALPHSGQLRIALGHREQKEKVAEVARGHCLWSQWAASARFGHPHEELQRPGCLGRARVPSGRRPRRLNRCGVARSMSPRTVFGSVPGTPPVGRLRDAGWRTCALQGGLSPACCSPTRSMVPAVAEPRHGGCVPRADSRWPELGEHRAHRRPARELPERDGRAGVALLQGGSVRCLLLGPRLVEGHGRHRGAQRRGLRSVAAVCRVALDVQGKLAGAVLLPE
mmetsp:Transcript_84764/g.245071  ORF Transcript_84764/g.245071 Transcript_84764/m.245071 type:complete len:264 (-) Transcript_84764:908-1699(-)